MQIIGDRKKKGGDFEYEGRFYTPGKKQGAFTIVDEWCFINNEEIKRQLGKPRIEKVSSNHSYYYFDDFDIVEK